MNTAAAAGIAKARKVARGPAKEGMPPNNPALSIWNVYNSRMIATCISTTNAVINARRKAFFRLADSGGDKKNTDREQRGAKQHDRNGRRRQIDDIAEQRFRRKVASETRRNQSCRVPDCDGLYPQWCPVHRLCVREDEIESQSPYRSNAFGLGHQQRRMEYRVHRVQVGKLRPIELRRQDRRARSLNFRM